METIALSIVFIFFMAGVFFTWFFIHKAKSKERLIMIEKGLDLPQHTQSFQFGTNFPWLKVGIIVVCMGVGLLFSIGFQENGATIGFVFLFGGLGLIIANFTGKPKVQK